MNLIHHSTPTAGNRAPRRPAIVRRAQCSTPLVSNSAVSAGIPSAPLRSGGGEPITVSVVTRSGRRAAKARAMIPPIFAPHQMHALNAERVHEAHVVVDDDVER